MPEPLERVFEDAINDSGAASGQLASGGVESAGTPPESSGGVTGEGVSAEQSTDGAPPATETTQKMVPESALVGVRKDLQNKVSDLERQLQAVRTAQQQANAPQPEQITEDDYDDPQKLVAKIESRFQQKFDAYRYSSSEEAARSQFSDYDEVIAQYQGVAAAQPGLAQAVDQAALPAVAAYRAVKQHLEAQTMGDPKAVEQRVAAEVEKRVAEAMEQVKADLGSRLPSGIAAASGATGAGTAEGVPWAGRTSLSKI